MKLKDPDKGVVVSRLIIGSAELQTTRRQVAFVDS